MPEIILHPATRADAPAIRRMIRIERLYPLSLDWRRFIVAEDGYGRILACVQIKPHADGTRELASLVVIPEFRGQGLARRLIETVLEHENGTVYLTCRASLQPFYVPFGFMALSDLELPPYFRRLRGVFLMLKRLFHLSENLAVMRLEKQ